jgi:predicted CXXCH cytochrome family protein
MTRSSNRIRLLFLLMGISLIFLVAAALTPRAQAARRSDPPIGSAAGAKPSDDYCLGCHSRQGLTKTLPSGEVLSLYIDPGAFHAGVHDQEAVACVDCHTNISAFPHPELQAYTLRDVALKNYTTCQTCHADQFTKTLDSVHQTALASGNTNAAVCTDCHNPHQQIRITDKQTGALLDQARLQIPRTCARCHSAIYNTYKDSVHGAALTTEGNLDVPTCIDCHGVHNIQNPTTARFRNDTPQLCAKCHTDPGIMDKYGITTQVLNTYVSDFHGTTVTLFEQVSPDTPTNKPVCTDCHGVHNITNVDDPATGIAIKANLLGKCQRCHPGVTTENFTDAWMSHYVAGPGKFPLVYYVNLFYKFLIPAVIGGMLLFVVTDFVRRTIEARKGTKRHG